jgi:hypothetical protein
VITATNLSMHYGPVIALYRRCVAISTLWAEPVVCRERPYVSARSGWCTIAA